jgi:hypothetical protein
MIRSVRWNSDYILLGSLTKSTSKGWDRSCTDIYGLERRKRILYFISNLSRAIWWVLTWISILVPGPANLIVLFEDPEVDFVCKSFPQFNSFSTVRKLLTLVEGMTNQLICLIHYLKS